MRIWFICTENRKDNERKFKKMKNAFVPHKQQVDSNDLCFAIDCFYSETLCFVKKIE